MTEHLLSDYALPADKTDELLAYPFDRPQGSFMTDGTTVTELPSDLEAFYEAADASLRARRLPAMADRIAVVGYGANSNPIRSAAKMSAFGPESTRTELQTIPNLEATLTDTQIVWHGKPGQTGSVFAELYSGPETVGKESKVHVSFLTPNQLAMFHATEGTTYHLAWLDVLAGTDRQPRRAVAYIAGESEILLKDGQPVPVKRAKEDGEDGAMSAEQAVDYMLSYAGDTVGVSSARELIQGAAGLTLAEKKQRQAAVSERLGELGLNKKFRYPVADNQRIGRADFNSFIKPHHVLQLAEQVLAPIRPSLEQIDALTQKFMTDDGLDAVAAGRKARKKLDIAEAIRTRAYQELAERLEADKL